MRKSLLRSALPLLLLLFAGPVLAQPGAGTMDQGVLMGTVSDTGTQKPMAGVGVIATSPGLMGEQMVITDAQGNYRIPQLPVGTYALRFEKESFKPYAHTDIQLRANRTVRVNAELVVDDSPPLSIIGAPPTLDVRATTRCLSIDEEFIKRIAVARPAGKDGATRSQESPSDSAISGTVIDVVTRKPIADMVVTAVSPSLQKEETGVTDLQGNFRIGNLPPGRYTLRFERMYYHLYKREDLQVEKGHSLRVHAELAPDPSAPVIECGP